MATKKATLADGPHIPAKYEAVHVAAIQALQRGDATEHQQKEALRWLIEEAAVTYQFHFYDQARATDFALGRAFVGQQIVKLLKLDLSILRRNET